MSLFKTRLNRMGDNPSPCARPVLIWKWHIGDLKIFFADFFPEFYLRNYDCQHKIYLYNLIHVFIMLPNVIIPVFAF